MSIKRFVAKTTSEALRKVRDALGPEGVILSNRSVDGGIEILALHQDAMSALIPSRIAKESGATFSPQLHVNSGVAGPGYRAADFRSADEGFQSSANGRPWAGEQRQDEIRAERPNSASFGATPQLPERTRTAEATSFGNRPLSGRALSHANETIQADAQPAASVSKSKPGREQASENLRPPKRSAKAVRTPAAAKKAQPDAVDTHGVASEVAASVLKEIKAMRGALEQQLASLSWNDEERRNPMRGQILKRLLKTGFSEDLIRELVAHMPAVSSEVDAINHVKSVLGGKLKTIGNEHEMLEKGGVYALVGPTGVGKTTTTAKLAARCVVRHGADKLALLTTDGYRIGGHEQLRIYGKILGVAVHAVRDKHDLALALTELRGKHLVLIDTVGMGQRDRMVAEQVAMFAGCGTEVKRLLLLNAASNGYTLNEVAHAYRGDGLAGAIITKLDEAVILGCALDTAVRHALPLYYVAQGQRVPEDLELADAANLLTGALDSPPTSSFDLPDEGILLPMTVGNQDNAGLDTGELSLG
ncbi:flagellar biosynthesis protein FlhF [Nitrosospira sp. Nsp2]|uniref:flagellar biosynthesis protein FlhF n=1 Tax=Nitrosospira sp. Nsp2 TaxID=136548 RepID=UPI000D31DBB8|nr:flagellar biosynthesis protein FlhF [Nitrosospira sp. Nsp2]PTR16444.1 flagellar biosynthesis protein FlhF [Nitrosospira sp. Nsp2]